MFYIRKNIPIIFAVVLSLCIIGATLWYVQSKRKNTEIATEEVKELNLEGVRGLQADDHILGNPQAPIVLFVYSDFSCPYCADYHETLRTLMRTYGSEGKVAIVFRQMPLVQLHPEAPMYALASECVASEAGNQGFWKFADDLFKNHDPLKPFTPTDLVVLAENAGATRQSFVTCMRSNELMALVEEEYQEGIDTGATGSPFSILEAMGQRVEYQGAQSYRTLAVTIQTLQRKLELSEHGEQPTNPSASTDFIDDFEHIDIGGSATGTPVEAASSTEQAKAPSILDGIVEEN